MIIEFIAAPLIVLSLPHRSGNTSFLCAVAASGIFAAALWFWHLPWAYDWTFRNGIAYWSMHISLLSAAILLWYAMLNRSNPAGSFLVSSLTAGQMGLLGALYTFANRPLFSAHRITTEAWGLSSLEDQQLGGLIM